MLSCESCSYIKAVQTNSKEKSVHMCEFTGFVFREKLEDYEMENHPCYEYDYKTYELEQARQRQDNANNVKIA